MLSTFFFLSYAHMIYVVRIDYAHIVSLSWSLKRPLIDLPQWERDNEREYRYRIEECAR